MKETKKRGKYGQYKLLDVETRGAPTTLTDELFTKIKALYMQGKSASEIYNELEITASTWFSWKDRNTLSFAEKINQWQQEYIVNIAQEELQKLVKDTDNRIKLDALKFALERLNKKDFSVRQETKALPVDEKLEENEKDRINDLLKDNKKEIKGEPIATYEEAVVK